MKLIDTKNAPGAIGPYVQGYVVNGIVYTSGQIPASPADRHTAKTARQIFSSVSSLYLSPLTNTHFMA